MISRQMMNADVTINYRPKQIGVDSYNQPLFDDGQSVTVKGYYRPRRSRTVVSGGSELLEADAIVLLQPSVLTDDIESVEVEGMRFSLDGDPLTHWNPNRVRVTYKQLDLRRGSN